MQDTNWFPPDFFDHSFMPGNKNDEDSDLNPGDPRDPLGKDAASAPESGSISDDANSESRGLSGTIRTQRIQDSRGPYSQGPSSPSKTQKIPSQIGRYRPKKILGRGGMGTVYLARQDEPVQRNVALKVITVGKDSDEVVARFEAERQAIAIMTHQNIAKLLDAGITEDGIPYFAMEYIPGKHITDHCDDNSLSIRERLQLFLGVCRGVEHAHQKGLIHRDLKPSNVIVANDQSEAIPKIIDFGLAKAIDDGTNLVETQLTAIGQILGTVRYMSPEQALQGSVDLDIRTDIYSLGILLYELLTGGTPLKRETLKSKGIFEIVEILRSDDPVRPSVYLSGLGQELQQVCEKRKNTPSRLGQIMKGDLDWIVMKALEIDRTRRYSSTTQFAEDISKFLNNEPVSARPPSTTYRLKKMIRRNRITVAFTVALSLTLIVGTVVSISWAIKAIAAERQSNVARDRALGSLASIQQFVLESPVWQADNPAREALLDLMATEYSFWVEDSSKYRIDPSTLAPVMIRLATLDLEMGRYDQSAKMARDAIQLLNKSNQALPETRVSLAEAESVLARMAANRLEYENVRQLRTRIKNRLEKIDSAKLTLELAIRYCEVMYSMTKYCYFNLDSKQSYSNAAKCKEFCKAFESRFPESQELRYQTARCLILMGKSIHKGRAMKNEVAYEKRLSHYGEAEEILDGLLAVGFKKLKSKRLICEAVSNRGLRLRFLIRDGVVSFDDVIENYDKGLEICEEVLADYPGNLHFEQTKGLLLLNKADFLSDFDRATEEEALRFRAHQTLKKLVASTTLYSDPGENFVLNQLGYMLNQLRLEKDARAVALAQELAIEAGLENKADLDDFCSSKYMAREIKIRRLAFAQLLVESGRFDEIDQKRVLKDIRAYFRTIINAPTERLSGTNQKLLLESPIFADLRSDPEFVTQVKKIASTLQ